ncbi:unnamed protein product [Staurois parvus]|uniref:Uncharacterized protein n=1 Tax=Staurois parvus TaxID=386267 RepID=A0ABN9BTC1_9NEOB|nr:unnamed protein product [Staurois parvus]
MLSLCVLLERFFFFFLGSVHVISTGSISTVQTGSGVLHLSRAERKLLQALTSALLKSQDKMRKISSLYLLK